jgi:hypothetical protein
MDELRATDALNADWTVLLLLVCIGVLGWINLVSPKKWRLISGAFFSFRLGRQSMRDDIDPQDRTLIVLVLMSSCVIALFLYEFGSLKAGLVPGLSDWAKVLGVSLVALLAQVLVLNGLRFLFQGDGGLSEYLYTLLLLHVALGIALLPITGVLAFPHHIAWRSWLAWTGLVISAAIVFFRWVRAVVIGVGAGVPVRYIFLYLCALEILPVVLLLQASERIVPNPSH